MTRVGLLAACAVSLLWSQDSGAEFFENKIRPVLATHCYSCHSSALKAPMADLRLDTRDGTRKALPKLLSALQYKDAQLRMPPAGKLAEATVADFEKWIAMDSPDPRAAGPAPPPARVGMPVDKGRSWWAFQPLRAASPLRSIDQFVTEKLAENKLTPSPEAAKRTLIRRAYLDLIGLPASYAEVEAFAADPAPDAYGRLIDRLLATRMYGERWGRYWLDVARWGEDNPTTEATNPPYPLAWRYRDWVIEAINKDIPYDRFVRMQLAADLLPGFEREDMRALGYIGLSPTYHKDARLSRDVIETIASDDWDERVDAVSRGLLGLTVACARCHDHKFDPITTKDYHALAGVFASTWPVRRPLLPLDPKTERDLVWSQERITRLTYLANLLRAEPGTKPEEAKQKEIKFRAELASLQKSIPDYQGEQTHAVVDAGLWIDGSDPDLTHMDYRLDTPRDLPVFVRGNVANPGERVPRRFLEAIDARPFERGSGRLELADRIFGPAAPLAARVIVNRVWGWHFGQPIVPTPSDFGTQGERPSHPELLEDLAARFVSNGWSLKWLHREIMLSAAYKQSSRPRADADRVDPTNRWLWRMNPRRLDFESWRDSILAVTGELDSSMYGPSTDLDVRANRRRTVYAKVSRARLHTLLKLYDFPDPTQHSPGRETTTTPLQQLFAMNSDFLRDQASALARRIRSESNTDAERVRALYRAVLSRDPKPREADLGLTYLRENGWNEYVQVLLGTNELSFFE